MNKNAFEVMGLDKDFQIVGLLRYTNLQWRRKWYESGTFSVQIPLEQYDPAIKYIYTKDRPEVGEISQINYIDDGKDKVFALSGYFLENELNRRIAYIRGSSNIENAPDWLHTADNAENVATAFFDAFKDVTVGGSTYELGINTAPSQGRGKNSDHYRQGEYLGNKIHTILKPSEMSYRINYDFIANSKTFECIKGVDRTQLNSELNNPVIFSTRYGNLVKPNIVWSDSDYKNAYITSNTYEEENTSYSYTRAGIYQAEDDTDVRFVNSEALVMRSDFADEDDYFNALDNEGYKEMLDNPKTFSFDFGALEGSYDYRVDFDLGDKCSLEVKEIHMSVDAVLTGCIEVIKNGTWTLSLEFDV